MRMPPVNPSPQSRTNAVRAQNTRLVLDALRRQQAESHTHLVEQTGLAAATVSSIATGLVKQNVLQNRKQAGNEGAIRRGRPRVSLSLNPQVGCIAVISLSLNHLAAQLVDYSGQVRLFLQESLHTLDMDEAGLEFALLNLINRLVCEGGAPALPLRHITISVQGVMDASGDILLWSPIMPLHNVHLKAMLSRACQVPIRIDNDCNMIVRALHHEYPQRLGDDFAVILLGQGIGMGLLLQGKPFTGRQSSAGEFGHMTYQPDGNWCRCGQQGCIEAYAGEYALWRQVHGHERDAVPAELLGAGELASLYARALQEEGVERAAFRGAGKAIGHGLRSLFALIDPVPVVFVGHGTRAFSIMEPEIRQILQETGKLLNAEDTAFCCFEDAEALILQGCTLLALQTLDWQFSQLSVEGLQ